MTCAATQWLPASARQHAAFHVGEAISQRTIGDLLAKTFDRVITAEAHLHRSATLNGVFPGIETSNLSAAEVIAENGL